MVRKKKQVIKVNNTDSLESLLQETYSDACDQITDAQANITELRTSTDPEDVRDHTEIAAQKTNALKIKDSAIKIKLEIAKLQNEILKNSGDVAKVIENEVSAAPTNDDFSKIRKMIEAANSASKEVVYTLDKK